MLKCCSFFLKILLSFVIRKPPEVYGSDSQARAKSARKPLACPSLTALRSSLPMVNSCFGFIFTQFFAFHNRPEIIAHHEIQKIPLLTLTASNTHSATSPVHTALGKGPTSSLVVPRRTTLIHLVGQKQLHSLKDFGSRALEFTSPQDPRSKTSSQSCK